MIERSGEAEAFLEAIAGTDPTAVSACAGWTAHEVAAHVAGIAIEVNRHLDPFLQGDPVPETRTFEEREAPLQRMGHEDLLVRLDIEEGRMRAQVTEAMAKDPDSIVRWTGRTMVVAKFIPHLRNEHALHRWDIVGDDDTSTRLLSQADLTEHSVEVLGRILLVAGTARDPEPGTPFRSRLRSPGHRDLSVVVRNDEAALTWDDASDQPGLDLDAAARLLLIWGRRPDRRGRLHSHLSRSQLARLQALLSGY